MLLELATEVQHDLAGRLDRSDLPGNLIDAIRYSVLGGGKRLRPALTQLSCQAVGGDRSVALPAAAAIEMIHCFSLVHDDLPAMDDDDLRRGQPTLHIQTNEAMAILAGDAMISLAFEMLCHNDLPETLQSRLVWELSTAMTAMIGGQVYDTLKQFPPGLSEDEKLLVIDRNKTMTLIRCACRLGALCGSADDSRLKSLSNYGEAIGLMFQIVDDLLDVTQTREHTGKATGKDIDAGKITYPGLHGEDESRKEITRLQKQALAALEPLGEPAAPLGELCTYLSIRTR